MIPKSDIDEILRGYDRDKISISTYTSHSFLNIILGAKEEGFKTIGIGQPQDVISYSAFQHSRPEKFLPVGSYKEMLGKKKQKFLRKNNTIVIPHGSFVEYVKPKNLEEKFLVPMEGNRKVLAWESDRNKQREWLESSGVKIPKEFKSPADIDRLCITKFHGAKGGHDFFFAQSEKQFYAKMKEIKKNPERDKHTIQEYVLGSRFYPHMFFSPFSERGMKANNGWVELLGYDIRRESNIDELHRTGLSRKELEKLGIQESFTVVGNEGTVPREKLEARYLAIGKQIIEASQKLFSPGVLGPFCPETICTKDLDIYTFEITPRIVAGTNIWVPIGAPEAYHTWGENMYMGKRIAREIKMGIEKDRLEEIVY